MKLGIGSEHDAASDYIGLEGIPQVPECTNRTTARISNVTICAIFVGYILTPSHASLVYGVAGEMT
jgi:hypothetical protein